MIKAAYTARELAELKLPGWPQSARAFELMARKEFWPKTRASSNGRAVAYPVVTLPGSLACEVVKHQKQRCFDIHDALHQALIHALPVLSQTEHFMTEHGRVTLDDINVEEVRFALNKVLSVLKESFGGL